MSRVKCVYIRLGNTVIPLCVLSALLMLAGCGEDEEVIACPALHVLEGKVLPGNGVEHWGRDLTSDQTWAAKDSPHRVMDIHDLVDGRTLTLEPCAVVVMQSGAALVVGDESRLSSGDLVAEGTAEAPILITGAQTRAGGWDKIAFIKTTAESRLAHVTVEHAGDNQEEASVYLASDNVTVEPMVTLDHVTIRDGKGDGLVMQNLGELGHGSAALTVTGMTGFPVRASSVSARTVPEGSYTGNGDDRIRIDAQGALVASGFGDVIWPNRGVPVLYDMRSYQSWEVTLTVSPGLEVSIKNDPEQDPEENGVFTFLCGGAIVADGQDSTQTITFQGENGRHWAGFKFMDSSGDPCQLPAGQSTFNYVRILDAGTQPSCDNDWMCPGLDACYAAILLEGPYLQMTHTELVGIADDMYGITRHYCGEGDEGLAAQGLGNRFVGPMYCPQSDQNECNPPGGACDENTSCCLHDLTCHGEIE